MKSTIHTNNRLKQIRKLPPSDRQIQHNVENNGVREIIAGPEMGLVHSANQPVETSDKAKICIKNMVSIRCKMVVQKVLENLGVNYSSVELGEVEITGNLSDAKQEELKSNLLWWGLELIEDKKSILVEKIKKVIIDAIYCPDGLPDIKFSDYISQKLNHDYTFLSKLFSEVIGISIQQFIISHKIERVKELLLYDELCLAEIAWKLKYSSVAHLSNQFKKMTELTPTEFKEIEHHRQSG